MNIFEIHKFGRLLRSITYSFDILPTVLEAQQATNFEALITYLHISYAVFCTYIYSVFQNKKRANKESLYVEK